MLEWEECKRQIKVLALDLTSDWVKLAMKEKLLESLKTTINIHLFIHLFIKKKKTDKKITHKLKLAKSRCFVLSRFFMRDVIYFEFNSLLLRYSVTVVKIVLKIFLFDYQIMNTYLKFSFYHGMSCYLVTSSIPDLDIRICSFSWY